jgi:hypothetical protein
MLWSTSGMSGRRCRVPQIEARIAIAQFIPISVYHLLTEGTVSGDLEANDFAERDRQAVERRFGHRREGLGDTLSLNPAAYRVAGRAYLQARLVPFVKRLDHMIVEVEYISAMCRLKFTARTRHAVRRSRRLAPKMHRQLASPLTPCADG